MEWTPLIHVAAGALVGAVFGASAAVYVVIRTTAKWIRRQYTTEDKQASARGPVGV